MNQTTFFHGLKVVELASVLAGPAVGMFFAELGAEVVKVENKLTGGDTTRHWKLPKEDAASPASAYFHAVNWNKRHIFMDLSQEADRLQLMYFVKNADVVISNFKMGAAKKFGLDYKTLMNCNPRLIYASISAYGEDDLRPGFDVAIQAETGWMYMNGEADGPPVKMPVALMDILAAHQLKEGILLALLERERTGKGCEVSVSLFDSGIASLANQASNWLNVGHLPQRIGSQHPNIAPYGEIFYSVDNKPLIVAVGTEQQFKELCSIIGLPGLWEDERFKTNTQRLSNRAALVKILASAFKHQSSEELLQKCHEKQVPIAPIRNLKEVFDLPEANDLVLEEQNEDGTVSKRVKSVVFNIK